MSAVQDLEKTLSDLFINNAPALPAKNKKTILQYLPWINLAAILLTLLAIYSLWEWAHMLNDYIIYRNYISPIFGSPVINDRLSPIFWLSLLILGIEAVIYIAAFPDVNKRTKKGWDLLF